MIKTRHRNQDILPQSISCLEALILVCGQDLQALAWTRLKPLQQALCTAPLTVNVVEGSCVSSYHQ